MEKPVYVERYGKLVWETPGMDIMRSEHCMCLHCSRMKIGEPDHCVVASKFFEICKMHGNAFILTRCDSWKEQGVKS
jgi:hypothetical protein